MFCSKCGKQAEGEFCWNCGSKLYVPSSDDVKQDNNNSQSINIVQAHETASEQRPLAPYSVFRATAKYPLDTGSFEIDSIHQMMRFVPIDGRTEHFHYIDIFDAELVQNGSSVLKTSTTSMINRSIIGAAISDDLKIIAGATASKYEQRYITELYVRIMLKNMGRPVVRIPLIANRILSDSYAAQRIMERTETILAQIKLAQSTPPIESAYEQPESNVIIKKTPEKAVSAGNRNWRCPECDYTNRGTVSVCANCGGSRPEIEITDQDTAEELSLSELYGKEDWFCPKCDLKNKAANKTCPNCGTVRPIPGSEQELHTKKKGPSGIFKK